MTRGALPRIALLALIWGSACLWIKLAAVMLARRDKVPGSLPLWASIATAALFANAVPDLLFAVASRR